MVCLVGRLTVLVDDSLQDTDALPSSAITFKKSLLIYLLISVVAQMIIPLYTELVLDPSTASEISKDVDLSS